MLDEMIDHRTDDVVADGEIRCMCAADARI